VSKALSFVSLLFGLLVIGSTYALLAGPDNAELRAQLVGILVVEGVAFTGLMLFLVRPIKVAEATPPPKRAPRERDRLPPKPIHIPTPIVRRQMTQADSPAPRTARKSDPLEACPVCGPRMVTLPPLPVLQSPAVGRGRSGTQPPPTPTTPEPRKPRIKLTDLHEQAPLPPPPPPRPKRQTKIPKKPAKTQKLRAGATDLPTTLTVDHLPICVNIVTLATFCATADNGASSTDEDRIVESWIWTVVEHVSADADLAWTYHDELFAAHEATRLAGQQKLELVKSVATSIKDALGRSKLLNVTAWLCAEVIKADEKLDPGEAAIFRAALEGLGKADSEEFRDMAKDLLLGHKEVKALLAEFKITEKTPIRKTEEILLEEFGKCNARMQACAGAAKEQYRQKMKLITRIRDMLREIEAI